MATAKERRIRRVAVIQSSESLKRYGLGDVLGEGGFGQAFVAWQLDKNDRRTSQAVCLKVNTGTTAWHRECYFGEVLRKVPGTIQLLDSFVALQHGKLMYCSVFELAECSLADQLSAGSLGWSEKRCLTEWARLLKALVQLHQWGAMHRDLTPMNVLMMPGTGQLRMADFGITIQGKDGKVDADVFNQWHAPESKMLTGAKWRPRDDVWQMGQLLAALVRGSGLEVIEPRDVRDLGCSDGTKALIYRCLTEPPFRFDSAEQVWNALVEGADIRLSKAMSVKGKRVVFTGPMMMRRADIASRARRAGAVVQDDVGWSTDLVVVGAESSNWVAGTAGTKILQALSLQDKGSSLKFVSDATFVNATARAARR